MRKEPPGREIMRSRKPEGKCGDAAAIPEPEFERSARCDEGAQQAFSGFVSV